MNGNKTIECIIYHDIQEIKSVLWLIIFLILTINTAPIIACIIPASLSVGFIISSLINYKKGN